MTEKLFKEIVSTLNTLSDAVKALATANKDLSKRLNILEDFHTEPEPKCNVCGKLATMKLTEIAELVADAACYWDYVYSITSECRLSAAIKTYQWAKTQTRKDFPQSKINQIMLDYYRYFEYHETLSDELMLLINKTGPN